MQKSRLTLRAAGALLCVLMALAPIYTAMAQIGPITVIGEQKISDTQGGLMAPIVDNDAFGHSVAHLGDLDGDGVGDIAVGAPYVNDGGTHRGAVYILFLNADGTVKAEQKISSTSGGLSGPLESFDFFGLSVANIGDFNGDGVVDIAVGAPGDDGGGTYRGAVYILFLNANGTVWAEQKITENLGGFTTPLDNGDWFGSSVDAIGDLDGDGVVDIVVGAMLDDDGGTNRGAVYILFLNANGTVKAEQKISDTQGGFMAPFGGMLEFNFGIGVAGLGDADGDGVADIAVVAREGSSGDGKVYILFLNADGTVKAEQEISDTKGGLITNFQGAWSVANLGDLDGDGVPDIAVGARWYVGGGAVHILLLNANGTVWAQRILSATDGGVTGPLQNGDYFGSSVAGLGDFDGDAQVDIVVGAYGDESGFERGAVYILNLDGTGGGLANTDGDGDGVHNAVDLCPNTPAGGTVNADGCPVAATDLSLVKTASVSVIEPGIPFNYTLTVSNNGAEAHNVTVIDNIPAGLTIQGSPVASDGGAVSVNGQTVTATWGLVPDGVTRTLTITVVR